MTLIEKLEKVETGSEKLDREIHEALGWRHIPSSKLGLKRCKERWERDGETSWFAPRYTTSIDDALTAFPEDWGWWYNLNQPGWDGGFLVNEARATIHNKFSSGGNYETGFAATMPLAICIASLKAIAHDERLKVNYEARKDENSSSI